MAAVAEIGTLIGRDTTIRSGRPKIAGTGLSVSRIAGRYKTGLTPEEIAPEYPHLTLAQVHGALAYYHANREEIRLTWPKKKLRPSIRQSTHLEDEPHPAIDSVLSTQLQSSDAKQEAGRI